MGGLKEGFSINDYKQSLEGFKSFVPRKRVIFTQATSFWSFIRSLRFITLKNIIITKHKSKGIKKLKFESSSAFIRKGKQSGHNFLRLVIFSIFHQLKKKNYL